MSRKRIDRRDFIRTAGTIAAVSSASWLLAGCSDGDDRRTAHDQGVIVIGALSAPP